MHSKNIFRAVVAALIFFSPTYIFGQKAKSGPNGKVNISVKQEVDLLFTNLKKNLKKEPLLKTKFEKITEFQKKMTQLRKKNARQLENEEIMMDLLVTGLEMIPAEQDFKKASCPQYRQKIIQNMSPNVDQGEPMDASTQSTLDVLSILCK